MAPHWSLDKYKLIAAVLHDVSIRHGAVFNHRSLVLTLDKVKARLSTEGEGFLTKTLPKLGKAFDKALGEVSPLNASALRFKPAAGSKLPKFLGELFSRVLTPDGVPLPDPCKDCVRTLRQILYLFYKYELPYSAEQEQQVVSKFERTEDDLSTVSIALDDIRAQLENTTSAYVRRPKVARTLIEVAREARILLSRLFASFDPLDIYPRHGPGAVATKQQLWDKYHWVNISEKITAKYALDAYFYASLTHFCDDVKRLGTLRGEDLPARVCLVPKDSRGPRLISCEPVDYQWVQQGLGRAIVELVEKSCITKYNVHFTDQGPNQRGALLGSKLGKYATLDLNEASDRVSLSLVRLLFPPHICECLEACRSSATVLPTGKVLKLKKHAPMGSSLCFPIMALAVWAILTAAAPDADTRECILVYGDDVVVPTAFAGDAIEKLESFGLKVNQDKSFTKGFFRESCGVDAFKGYDVTPVKLKTVWSSTRSPESFVAWVAYANSLYERKYFCVYDYIVEGLLHLYGPIPAKELGLLVPSLPEVPEHARPLRRRNNTGLQKLQYYVLDTKAPVVTRVIDGWSMLLRYFAEKGHPTPADERTEVIRGSARVPIHLLTDRAEVANSLAANCLSVSEYTRRGTSMLVRRWR